MNNFRYSETYRMLALLLLVICTIGFIVPTYAAEPETVDLTANVNAFTGMAGSGLTVTYDWTANPTGGFEADAYDYYQSDGKAAAADDVITVLARGWCFESPDCGSATLTLTLTNGSTEEKTLEFTLTETSVSGTVTIKLNDIEQTKAADGKYSFVLAVGESCTVILNTAVPTSDTSGTAAAYEEIQLSNLAFYGEAAASAKLTVEDDPAMAAYSATTGAFEIVDGTVSGLSVDMPSGYRFIGWVNKATGVVISSSQTTINNLTGDTTVYPLCAPADYPVLRVGSTDYYYWQDAFAAAANGSDKKVIVYSSSAGASGTLPAEASRNRMGTYVTDADGDGKVTYIIPSGCQLLLPFSTSDAGCWGALTNGKQASTADPSTWYTLNLASGATMVCNGEMNVNGQWDENGQKYTGGPAGAHGLLKLNGTGTQLTVNGSLYCYGFIAGTGKTEVNGTIYEMLQMADFAGGQNSSDWSAASKNDDPELFVLTQYYIQNVESPLRINYGATHRIVTTVYVSKTPFDQDTVFVGKDGLFILNDSASYIERTVNCGSSKERAEYVLGGGGITFGSMSVKFVLAEVISVTLNSQDHVLPLPSLMTIRVTDKASVTMGNALALLPGAEVHVESGASATLTNKLFIFDKSDWKSTYFYQAGATKLLTPPYYTVARGTKIPAAAYSEADKSGLLEINGTLNVTGSGGLYTTNGSNTDKVLRGTGTVNHSGQLSFTTDYDVKNDKSVYGDKQKQYKHASTNTLYVGFAKESVLVGESSVYNIFTGSYSYPDVNKDFIANTVTVNAVTGNYAVTGTAKALPSTGTYHGVVDLDGVNWWYINKTGEKAATCTDKGYIVANCGSGSQTIYTEAAKGHSYGAWTQTKAPTCCAKGEETRTCSSCGGTETREVAATGKHVYSETLSHDANGHWYACTTSGCTAQKDYAAHSSTGSNVATCQAAAKCDACGVTYGGTNANNHAQSAVWTKDDSGHRHYYPCCNADIVAQAAHSYTNGVCSVTGCGYECKHSGEEVTCSANGNGTHKVTYKDCGGVENVSDDCEYNAVVTSPTCEKGGYTTYTCKHCGYSYTGAETDYTGHNYDDGIVTTSPTCETEGVKTFTCSKCDETYTEAVEKIPHAYEAVVTDPTCTVAGYTTYTCSVCDESYVADEVAALGHTEETVAGKDATCTETGLTEGKHCSVCSEVLVAQETVAALGHKEVVDAAVAATCTEAGKTEGKHCSVCNETLVAQETVAALGHKEVVDAAVAATCTKTGLTEGKHCSVCNEVTVAQEVVSAKGHTEVIDAAAAATCTTTGLTEGKHCSVCNEVLVAQEEIAALGHTEVTSYVHVKDTATHTVTVTCSTCKETLSTNTEACADTDNDFACDKCGALLVNAYTDAITIAEGYNGDKTVDGTTVTLKYTGDLVFAQGTGTELWANWVGFKITAPVDMSKITILRPDNETRVMENIKDGENYAYLYWGMTEDNKQATYQIDWNNDGAYDLTVVLDASDATLLECAHAWDEGKVTAEPAFNVAGETTYTCIVCNATKTEEIPALTGAAKIDETYYETLTDALAAAKEGETITLLADVVDQVTVSQVVTIDKNGYAATIVAGKQYRADESNGIVQVTYYVTYARGAFLTLKNEITLGVYFRVDLPDGVEPESVLDRVGLLVWAADEVPEESAATIENCTNILNNQGIDGKQHIVYTYYYSNGKVSDERFEAFTDGIPAKNLGDKLAFRSYFIDENGEYHYSQIVTYSPATYCYNRIKKSSDANEVALNIAILNYCTAAQEYFANTSGYDYEMTEAINHDLTDEQKNMNWDASLVRTDWSVDAAKQGALAKNASLYADRSYSYSFGANLTLKGAMDYMYYFSVNDRSSGTTTKVALDSVKIYMWTEEEFDAASVLTLGGIEAYEMQYNEAEKRYEYTFNGLPAKDMFSPIYACVVAKDADGNEYISGVQPYCAERFSYMNYAKASNSEYYKNLAKWIVIYGDAARTYFAD